MTHLYVEAILQNLNGLTRIEDIGITTEEYADIQEALKAITDFGHATLPGQRIELKSINTKLLDILNRHVHHLTDKLLSETLTIKIEVEAGVVVLERLQCPTIHMMNKESSSDYEHLPFDLVSYNELRHNNGLSTTDTLLVATNRFLHPDREIK